MSAAIDRLAAAGIATYETPGGPPVVPPAQPVSVVRLLEWQVRNLALEAWAGNGQPGSELDALGAVPPEGAPTTSEWLAAYLSGVRTPGADYARELVGEQDLKQPEAIEFPQLVAVLFASDAAMRLVRDPISSGPGNASIRVLAKGGPAPPMAMAAANPCGEFSTFISEVIGDVVKALHIPPPRVGDTGSQFLNQLLQGGANLVVGFLNWAIGGLVTIVIGGVKAALKPILDVIASVSSVLAIGSQVLGAVRPWAVRLIPERSSVHKAVGSEVVKDNVQAVVDLGGLTEWPPQLESCAQLVGVKLPPLKPIGAPVTWSVRSVPAGLATDEHHLDTLRDDPAGGMAELRLRVGNESAALHKDGPETTGLVDVSVAIRRNEFKDLKQTMIALATSLLAGLPDVVRGTAERLLRAPIDAVMEEVVSLADERGSVSVTVSYHGPPEPSPLPAVTPASAGLTGTWTGTAWSHFGDSVAFTVELTQTGSKLTGPLHMPTAICNKESTVTGTVAGAQVTLGATHGEITATFAGTVSGSSMSGTWESPAGSVCRADYGTWEASKAA